MPGTTITVTDATKGPFNLYNVLAGVQTAGLTVAQTYPAILRNCNRRRIQADPGNSTDLVSIASDGSVSTTNGIQLKADESVDDQSNIPDISLTQLWFTAPNTRKLNVDVE